MPMFADARGVGVLERPTSAIFESMYQETKVKIVYVSMYYLKVAPFLARSELYFRSIMNAHHQTVSTPSNPNIGLE